MTENNNVVEVSNPENTNSEKNNTNENKEELSLENSPMPMPEFLLEANLLNDENKTENNQETKNENVDNDEKKKELQKYKEELENLENELNKKNNLISELQNPSNPEFQIPELYGKLEAEKLFEMINTQKINKQKIKIDSVKSMAKELDEQFKSQLKIKENKINSKLEPFIKKNQDLSQEINSCKTQMTQLNSRFEKCNEKVSQIQSEKNEMEELIIKQEEKLNIFLDKLVKVEELVKQKTKLLKENESCTKELIKIIEDQKATIRELTDVGYSKNNNMQLKNYIEEENKNDKGEKGEVILPDIYRREVKKEINENNVIDDFKENSGIDEENKINSINVSNDNSIGYNLISNDEKNQKKLTEFKNMMNDLINNISD